MFDVKVPVRFMTPVTFANSFVPLVGVSVKLSEPIDGSLLVVVVPATVPCSVAPSGAASEKVPENASGFTLVPPERDSQPSMLNEPVPAPVV